MPTTTIDQYRAAKSTYLKLHATAKKELLARFHELEAELFLVQRELREDFGVKVSIRTRGVKRGKAEQPAAPPSSPRIAALQRRIAAQQKKIEAAKAAGKQTKAAEDKLYELEDSLRLALQ